MNTFLFYRRIRGPVFLVTFGVTALLAQWNILDFSRSWPLYLIVGGVLRLAEGLAFAAAPAAPYTAPYNVAAPYQPGAGWQSAGSAAGSSLPGTGLATLAPSSPAVPGAGGTPVREEER